MQERLVRPEVGIPAIQRWPPPASSGFFRRTQAFGSTSRAGPGCVRPAQTPLMFELSAAPAHWRSDFASTLSSSMTNLHSPQRSFQRCLDEGRSSLAGNSSPGSPEMQLWSSSLRSSRGFARPLPSAGPASKLLTPSPSVATLRSFGLSPTIGLSPPRHSSLSRLAPLPHLPTIDTHPDPPRRRKRASTESRFSLGSMSRGSLISADGFNVADIGGDGAMSATYDF